MKRLLLLTGFVYLTFAVKAQPAFQASDILTTIGTNFTTLQMDYTDPGEAGMDVTWDFSQGTPSENSNVTIVGEGSSHPNAIYPTANLIYEQNEGGAYEYYMLDESTFDLVGLFIDEVIEYFYTDPETMLSLPLNLNDEFTDTYMGNYSLPGILSSDFVGSRSTVVDGYGTLKLPWGDFNAYRLTTEISETETIDFPGVGVFEGHVDGTVTSWFVSGFPMPALTVTKYTVSVPSLGTEEEQEGIEYVGDFTFVGIDDVEIVDNLTVYPNPATDDLNIAFSKTNSEAVFMDLYDVRGRKLKSIKKAGIGTGDFNYTIDVSDVPAGFYLLKLASDKGEQGIKVVVK